MLFHTERLKVSMALCQVKDRRQVATNETCARLPPAAVRFLGALWLALACFTYFTLWCSPYIVLKRGGSGSQKRSLKRCSLSRSFRFCLRSSLHVTTRKFGWGFIFMLIKETITLAAKLIRNIVKTIKDVIIFYFVWRAYLRSNTFALVSLMHKPAISSRVSSGPLQWWSHFVIYTLTVAKKAFTR